MYNSQVAVPVYVPSALNVVLAGCTSCGVSLTLLPLPLPPLLSPLVFPDDELLPPLFSLDEEPVLETVFSTFS